MTDPARPSPVGRAGSPAQGEAPLTWSAGPLFASGSVCGEAEADAPDRLDSRGGAEPGQLGAQPADHRVQVRPAAEQLVAPHLVVQALVGPDPSGRAEQAREEVVLQRR